MWKYGRTFLGNVCLIGVVRLEAPDHHCNTVEYLVNCAQDNKLPNKHTNYILNRAWHLLAANENHFERTICKHPLQPAGYGALIWLYFGGYNCHMISCMWYIIYFVYHMKAMVLYICRLWQLTSTDYFVMLYVVIWLNDLYECLLLSSSQLYSHRWGSWTGWSTV